MYFVRKECDDNGKLISISVENVFKLEKKNVEHFIKNIFPKVANNKEEHVREKTMFYNHVKKHFLSSWQKCCIANRLQRNGGG